MHQYFFLEIIIHDLQPTMVLPNKIVALVYCSIFGQNQYFFLAGMYLHKILASSKVKATNAVLSHQCSTSFRNPWNQVKK